MTQIQIEIAVRFSAGAHVTNTVRGVRASSTSSAVRAAEVFGEKYFGKGFRKVLELPAGEPATSRFLVCGVCPVPLPSVHRHRRTS